MAITNISTQLDNTVKVFNNFYTNPVNVNATDYDVVRSYFVDVCQSINTADNFTAILFKIAAYTQESPMTLLDYIKGKVGLELSATMAYYLNSLKSKTTLYGVANLPVPNPNVQRNILI
jgi:hypothetical protein